eukprot:1157710-Pelagomonas_calceolata.AAC.4
MEELLTSGKGGNVVKNRRISKLAHHVKFNLHVLKTLWVGENIWEGGLSSEPQTMFSIKEHFLLAHFHFKYAKLIRYCDKGFGIKARH